MLFYSYELDTTEGTVCCLTFSNGSNVVTVARPKRKGRPSYTAQAGIASVPPTGKYTVLTWDQVPDGAKKVFGELGVKAA